MHDRRDIFRRMPRRRKDAHLLELAKRGAEEQFRELAQELKNLVDLFPHLRDSYDPDELPVDFVIAKGSGRLKRTAAERPQRLSAGARKAVSARMKRYWREWRKKKSAAQQ
jgi:hypothetical protein